MLGKKVAIDLGTQSIRLLVKGEDSIISEPAVMARDAAGTASGMLFGTAALRARAGNPALRLERPMAEGAVADQDLVHALLNLLVVRAVGRQRIFKPDLVVAVRPSLSGDDRRLVLDAAMQAGARTVYLIDSVMAGAIGAGVPVTSHSGHLVVDAGAGRTDVAVIAMESTIASCSLPGHGGELLASHVASRVWAVHGVAIDAPATEDLVSSLLRVGVHEERRLTVTGHCDGSTRDVVVNSTDFVSVLEEHVRPVVESLQRVLVDTPDRLLDGVHREGITFFGGASRLEGLDRHLSAASGIRAQVDQHPHLAVIRGAGQALDNLDVLKRNLMYIR